MNYKCRHCESNLEDVVIDLGHQPPSNAYLKAEDQNKQEISYPLKVFLCKNCWLVQLPVHASSKDLFTDDYAYFSSTSKSWCNHARDFVQKSISKLKLNEKKFVVEIASNDGYLLQYLKEKNIPCIGIEPTKATADASEKKGIKTIKRFFNSLLADEILKEYSPNKNGADLIIANNVVAHVPEINDFMIGIKKLLRRDGQVSIEFPHVLNLFQKNQFDTIYHEHFSYFSLFTFNQIVNKAKLKIIDVEKIKTHGGSLRVWLCHLESEINPKKSVSEVINEEIKAGLFSEKIFKDFQDKASNVKYSLLKLLIKLKLENKKIIGYGAAAKGNTLLNYAGVKKDLLHAVIDNSESKQGKFLPGSHIPIIKPDELSLLNPDFILVLPWNILPEIKKDLKSYKLITAIPKIEKHY